MNYHIQQGLRAEVAFKIAGFARSSYYYKSKGTKKGKRPSCYTCTVWGTRVENEVVVKMIQSIAAEPYFDYGYQRMALELKNLGFIINPKKVYRLMKENKLLYPIRKSHYRNKEYVKYSKPLLIEPFHTIEIDIKYVPIAGTRKMAYLLTALDTFTRMAIAWKIDYKMRNEQVTEMLIEMMDNVHLKYQTKTYRIRTDNGPQFISLKLKSKLENTPYEQEFIQPGTPQQNGHIESFHNTLSRLALKDKEFESLEGSRIALQEFYNIYNTKRIMKSLLGKAPVEFLRLWNEGFIGINKLDQKFFFKEKPGFHRGSSLEDLICPIQKSVSLNVNLTQKLI